MMRSGKRLHSQIPLTTLRDQTLQNYRRLPIAMTTLNPAPAYPVTISTALQALAIKWIGNACCTSGKPQDDA